MNSGWIKLHRKMTEWEWYTDVPTKTLFIHLLLTANSKPGKWRGIDVPVGAKITSREKLSKETGLSQQQVRTALNKLKSTNCITKSTTSTYTLIQLVNYEKYQLINQVSNQPSTSDQPTSNQPSTTNKNARKLEIKNIAAARENPVSMFGKFKNIPLTKIQHETFMEQFPESGSEVLEEVSRRIETGEAPEIRNHQAYLTAIAKSWGAGKPRYTGGYKKSQAADALPDWYSDTGEEFASEEERQQLLADIEKIRSES